MPPRGILVADFVEKGTPSRQGDLKVNYFFRHRPMLGDLQMTAPTPFQPTSKDGLVVD